MVKLLCTMATGDLIDFRVSDLWINLTLPGLEFWMLTWCDDISIGQCCDSSSPLGSHIISPMTDLTLV